MSRDEAFTYLSIFRLLKIINHLNMKHIFIGSLLLAALVTTSCKKDDDLPELPPPSENEVEVITTLRITFTDVLGVQPTVSATFRDPDGEGGIGPDIFDTIRLAPSTTYNASILLLNETASPVDTISNEVLDEGADHLFCFDPTGANVTISRTDTDGTYEIGLQSQWVTGAVSTGSVTITLKHQPGVKDGTCTPGDTDVEVTFVTEIQ
jgi:hypothetical protein